MARRRQRADLQHQLEPDEAAVVLGCSVPRAGQRPRLTRSAITSPVRYAWPTATSASPSSATSPAWPTRRAWATTCSTPRNSSSGTRWSRPTICSVPCGIRSMATSTRRRSPRRWPAGAVVGSTGTSLRACRRADAACQPRLDRHHRAPPIGDEHVDCEIVVNAAGYRAGEVMELVGRHLPDRPHVAPVLRDRGDSRACRPRDCPLPLLRDPDTSYYLRQERNSYILGPYEWQATAMWRDGIPEQFANMLWSDDLERLAPQILDAGERVPVLGEAGIARVVNGPIPYAPDGNPYLGPERGLRNFWHCNTFSFGIAQGGGAGKAIAEWILDGRPEYRHLVDRPPSLQGLRHDAVHHRQGDRGVPERVRDELPVRGAPGRPTVVHLAALRDAAGQGCALRCPWRLGTTDVVRPGRRASPITRCRSSAATDGAPRSPRNACAVRNGVAVLDLPGFTKIEITAPAPRPTSTTCCARSCPRPGVSRLCYALLPDGKVLSEFTRQQDRRRPLLRGRRGRRRVARPRRARSSIARRRFGDARPTSPPTSVR